MRVLVLHNYLNLWTTSAWCVEICLKCFPGKYGSAVQIQMPCFFTERQMSEPHMIFNDSRAGSLSLAMIVARCHHAFQIIWLSGFSFIYNIFYYYGPIMINFATYCKFHLSMRSSIFGKYLFINPFKYWCQAPLMLYLFWTILLKL